MTNEALSRQPAVFKLGGSLLDLPDLGKRIDQWSRQFAGPKSIWIVGGGKAVDQIRRSFSLGVIGEVKAHWDAIQAMESNAKKLHRSSPKLQNWPLIHSVEALKSSVSQSRNNCHDGCFFLTSSWMETVVDLPKSWSVTSDSIAARLAVELGLNRVVLVKSKSPPDGSPDQLAELGYIDAYLPILVRKFRLTLEFINLRSDDFHQNRKG
ncbi:MAG: hypothetical protein AAF623_21555 [Planctomycetota bacterium]